MSVQTLNLDYQLSLDTFQPPICMTRCGHSFCQQCLLAACPEPIGWPCPTCKHVHNHPATALPRNFFAEQIVESFRARPTGEFGFCEDHQQEITLREAESCFKHFISQFRLHQTSSRPLFQMWLLQAL